MNLWLAGDIHKVFKKSMDSHRLIYNIHKHSKQLWATPHRDQSTGELFL